MEQVKKLCKRCDQEKLIQDFYDDKTKVSGKAIYCKQCSLKIEKDRRDKIREQKVKKPIAQTGYKICNDCKEEKPLSFFYKDKRTEDGKQYKCIDCHKRRIKDWQKSDEGKKKLSKTNKKYRATLNPEQLSQYGKNYGESGKRSIACKKRYSENINWRLSCLLRSRILDVLKGKYKSAPSLKLLGCSVEFFKQHLESQFIEGMNWDNFGKIKAKENNFPDWWDIDHKTPCSKFNLADPEEQRACFNWSNCQPLWHKDNIKKSNKI